MFTSLSKFGDIDYSDKMRKKNLSYHAYMTLPKPWDSKMNEAIRYILIWNHRRKEGYYKFIEQLSVIDKFIR